MTCSDCKFYRRVLRGSIIKISCLIYKSVGSDKLKKCLDFIARKK